MVSADRISFSNGVSAANTVSNLATANFTVGKSCLSDYAI
jgi:hypothetical protein